VPQQDRRGLSRSDAGFVAALFVALLAAASLPLVLTDIAPLVDYPNHLARMYLLAMLDQSPALRQFYVAAWRPIPDLAMDVLVPPLLHFMSLATAGKAFIAATFFLLAGGAAALHHAVFRRWSAWPLLAFLLLYNRLLLWGFLNYLFGLGLAFWALAAWIMLRGRPDAPRFVVGCVLALAVYFAHLMAFGVYGAMILGYELGLLRRERPAWPAAIRALAIAWLPFVLPLALFALVGGAAPAAFVFGDPWRKFDLLFSVFDNYDRAFDVACFAVAVAGLAVAFWRGWVRLAPAIAGPLIVLAAIYLLMPSELFGATGADRRLPLVLALLLVAGSDWRSPSRRARRIFLWAALALFVLRLGAVAASWQASGATYARLLAGLDTLPEGSRVAIAFPGDVLNVEATPLVHLPVLAAARRAAFVPTLFVYANQQPIGFTHDYAALARSLSADALWRHFVVGQALDAETAAALPRCDAIVFVGKHPFTLRDSTGLEEQFAAPRFQIYRIVRR